MRFPVLFSILVVLFLSPKTHSDSPQVIEHILVYQEPGRFGGWPANHGIWSWSNEILVGFSRGYYKDLGPERHNIDREKAEEHWLARSLDGGKTWAHEIPAEKGVLIPAGEALHGITPPWLQPEEVKPCPGGIDFTHPDFAMTLRMRDVDRGPSVFYCSTDRGRDWNGPYALAISDGAHELGIAARTDYIVDGPQRCTLFLTAAKANGEEGRPFCARTSDGGKTWRFLSWIGPEPEGFAIMPATVRLSPAELVTAIRMNRGEKHWIDVYASNDDGVSWTLIGTPASDVGKGNPASLIRLQDGRLCLVYGYRAQPYGIRAQLSGDNGQTWTKPYRLRDDGGGRDLGYPRSVQRPDGKVLTVYYFQDRRIAERYIAATIWDPGKP